MKSKKRQTLGERMQCSYAEYCCTAAYAVLTEQITSELYHTMKLRKNWQDILKSMSFIISKDEEFEKFKHGDFILYGDTYNYEDLPKGPIPYNLPAGEEILQ